MLIGNKEYKERETELTADEFLRCGVIDEKYGKTFQQYLDIETDEKLLPKIWDRYKSLWLQRLAFFFVGDISGLALEKLTQDERQAVDDFFSNKFIVYLKRLTIKTLYDTVTEANANSKEST